jgi:hypothetical protein
MRNILNFKKLILLTAFFALVFAGCKDEEVIPPADRLFRPMINSATISMTWIKVGWDKYKGAKKYELQMSVDTFKTVLRTVRTDSTQMLFSKLDFDTRYQFRLQAIGDSIVASGDTIRSRYFTTDLATLDYPTLLTTPTSSDVIDKSIRVRWLQSSLAYTHIDVMVSKDSVYKRVTVTAAENLAGEKIISGLKAGTSYIVKIFTGDAEYRGKKTFKTVASQVFTKDVVDLRDSTDVQALSILTQAYLDNLALLHPTGYNLILSGGVTYTLPTINISVPVNMVTGLSFRGKAIMAVNGSFGIAAAAKVSKVRFEKIFFTGGTAAGKTKTDANYGGAYLINMNVANGNVDTLQFENCDIKYKRGAIRMQTTATIGLVKINNCLFDSIGGYGVVNNANAASRINDIVVSNSTIAHADKLFVCGQTLGINSITISNITTYCAPLSGGYFLDYNTNAAPGGVSISNSVFGPGAYNTLTPPTNAVNGMRFSTTAVPTTSVVNCFKTSDLTWVIIAPATQPNAPINDFVDLGKTSALTFGDVTTGNYKVIDTRLVKTIGDPRWW